jgi:hypothetical protein
MEPDGTHGTAEILAATRAGKLSFRLLALYWYYGRTEGEFCRNCTYLRRVGRKRLRYRCMRSETLHGHGSNWRLKWPACGAWKGGK